MPTLLDICATCSVIPEEVFCLILGHCLRAMAEKTMSDSDMLYPLVSIERYRSPSSVVGVGNDEGSVMKTTYGVVLRGEFVRANYASGDAANPTRDIYFKVVPKGTTDLPGVLLGFPALDSPPYGLV